MKKITYLFCLVLFALFIVSANSGATGMDRLVSIPTADLITDNGFVRAEVSSNSHNLIEASFLVQPRFEAGGRIVFDTPNQMELMGKIALAEGSYNEPAIAAGMRDDDIYLVGSKNFAYGLRGHLGFGSGDFGGFFIGINKTINSLSFQESEENSKLPINLMAEYVNETINLGVQVNFQQKLALELGLMDLKDFKAGLVYSF